MQHHYIITGVSRGLGEALALQLFKAGNRVTGISRMHSALLRDVAKQDPQRLLQLQFDLADRAAIAASMEVCFEGVMPKELSGVTLINNAATIQPIGLVGQIETDDELYKSILLNLCAPMALCESFIRRTQAWEVRKSIVNISSGAAMKPIGGWSAYCAAKAGLHMYTQTVAEEQERCRHPVRVVSFVPGILDTEMQSVIRSAGKERFPDVERFIQYRNDGKLADAQHVAAKLLKYLENDEFGAKPCVDIREIV